MAYSAPTSDFITSSLSGGITAAATTATIGTGVDLPATNGILQIHYDSALGLGVDEGPETIAYATYNSGTGALAGMTRGLNGTTGVAHATGAKVQSGPSASYWGSASILAADIANAAVTPVKGPDLAKAVDRQLNTTNSVVTNQLIQAGYNTTASFASATSKDITVTFPTAYDVAPMVVATTQNATGNIDDTTVSVTAITTTQFTARARVAIYGAATAVNVYWIAIGTKAR